jgi:hypothetical protein
MRLNRAGLLRQRASEMHFKLVHCIDQTLVRSTRQERGGGKGGDDVLVGYVYRLRWQSWQSRFLFPHASSAPWFSDGLWDEWSCRIDGVFVEVWVL